MKLSAPIVAVDYLRWQLYQLHSNLPNNFGPLCCLPNFKGKVHGLLSFAGYSRRWSSLSELNRMSDSNVCIELFEASSVAYIYGDLKRYTVSLLCHERTSNQYTVSIYVVLVMDLLLYIFNWRSILRERRAACLPFTQFQHSTKHHRSAIKSISLDTHPWEWTVFDRKWKIENVSIAKRDRFVVP